MTIGPQLPRPRIRRPSGSAVHGSVPWKGGKAPSSFTFVAGRGILTDMASTVEIRPAVRTDDRLLARLHVAAWAETYSGLLPPSEIARRTLQVRGEQWRRALDAGTTRILVAGDVGFVQMGPQRDADLMDWPEELYALYLLRRGQGAGIGRALLDAAASAHPFTALVIEGNDRACAFYERSGARLLEVRDAQIGAAAIRERLYAWGAGRMGGAALDERYRAVPIDGSVFDS